MATVKSRLLFGVCILTFAYNVEFTAAQIGYGGYAAAGTAVPAPAYAPPAAGQAAPPPQQQNAYEAPAIIAPSPPKPQSEAYAPAGTAAPPPQPEEYAPAGSAAPPPPPQPEAYAPAETAAPPPPPPPPSQPESYAPAEAAAPPLLLPAPPPSQPKTYAPPTPALVAPAAGDEGVGGSANDDNLARSRSLGSRNLKFPLPSCYINADGFMCCSKELEQVMDAAYKKISTSRPDWKKCNIQQVSVATQKAAEAHFNAPFEVVVGAGDYASKNYFNRDLICKIRREASIILAFATPQDA